MANKKEIWDRFAIAAEVKRRGSSLRRLSRENGLSNNACSAAMHIPIPRANKAIAKLLAVPVHVLWPDWYAKNGDRILSSAHSSRKIIALHSKMGEAA
ncbi:MAG: hypothetical protein COB24_11810 [Hyphomicrobiales bacterium]|nr:MAG: hypothetical protein COB24_11810 [Hyphomicrobiales bacterium]